MGLPKKGASKIQVADKSYRWAVSPDSGYMYVVVQLESGKGQRLHVLVDYEHPITPGVVRDYILEALKKGWKPEKPGSPFGLNRS